MASTCIDEQNRSERYEDGHEGAQRESILEHARTDRSAQSNRGGNRSGTEPFVSRHDGDERRKTDVNPRHKDEQLGSAGSDVVEP
jgi:hypothetical protein